MKKIFTGFIFLLFSCIVNAQNIKIISLNDNNAIVGATLQIKQEKVKEFKTLVSNNNGEVNLTNLIDSLTYLIKISSFGFEDLVLKNSGKFISQQSTIYLEPKQFNLKEIVVTAQYKPISQEQSIQKIKIISAEKIEAMGAVNLKDVLANETNMRVSQDNILGSSVSMQGISGENVKIMIDGVPVIGRLNGNIDLSQLNLNSVERIEVIEGPLSVQYGTNALAGTVNIITKSSFKNKINASISPYYESIGHYNLTTEVSSTFNNNSIYINGGRNYFDGWNSTDKLFDFKNKPVADTTRFKQWKPKQQYFGAFGYTLRFKKIKTGFKTNYFDEKITNKGMPRFPYYENAFDDYYYTKRLDNSVFINCPAFKHGNLNFVAAYNTFQRVKTTYFKDLTTLQQHLTNNQNDHDTSKFTQLMSRASYNRTKDSAFFNYEIGYDINHESAYANRIEDTIKYMSDYAVFATAEFKLFKNLLIKPGARGAYNSLYKTPFTPSLSVKYNLSAKNIIRFNYAQGFRAPGLKELFFLFVDINHDIIGNQNLKAEKSNSFSLYFTNIQNLQKAKFKTDISCFYNNIYNLITLANISGTQYTYANVGKYKTMGAQFNVSYTQKQFTINAGAIYTGRYNNLSETENVKRFSFSPELNSSVNYNWQKPKIQFSLFYKYNGKLPGFAVIDDLVYEQFIDSYNLLDFNISKSVLKNRIILTAGCKNIFDVKAINSTLLGGAVHSNSVGSLAIGNGRNCFFKIVFKL